ncbi:Sugar phosphate phosphatase [Aphelenchoides fujianensis]|nr:Sugar phosphate phosphatase [Aphelenchoides fujianensis]
MVVDAPPSSGSVKPSFAFDSITERWPRILTRIVDQMHQKHNESVKKFGESGDADVKHIIHNLSRLRYMIVTDKPLELLQTELTDGEVWNAEIKRYREKVGEKEATWYKLPWLFTECYEYRLIYQFFQDTKNFKDYDPFRIEKEKSYYDSTAHLLALATELLKSIKAEGELQGERLKTEISRLLQVSLWGNKADLSLSGGDPHFMSETLFKELHDLRANILVDDIDAACERLMNLGEKKQVDVILDNSGLELFTDLCLGELLVATGLATKVVFHGKAHPWYVSDVTKEDFEWVIETTAADNDPFLRELAGRWKTNVQKCLFEYKTHPFYTFGFAYSEMPERSPDLYAELQQSSFLIFKGDLNGRKLIGDRDWPPTTAFLEVLKGFQLTDFISLRTLKAETVAGLPEAAHKRMLEKFGPKDRSWQVSSDYAVAQAFFKDPSV